MVSTTFALVEDCLKEGRGALFLALHLHLPANLMYNNMIFVLH